jgi:hypothetical protein
MSIFNINTVFAGQVGVHPQIIKVETNNTYAEVTEVNFLANSRKEGHTFNPNDLALVIFADNSVEFFKIAIENFDITLVPTQGGHYATASNPGSDVQLTNPLAAITDVTVTTPSKIILPDFTEVNAKQAGDFFVIRNADGSDGGTLYKNDGSTAITTFTQSSQYAILFVTSNATANGTFIVANFLNNADVPSVTLPTTTGRVAQFTSTAGLLADGPVAANVLLTSAITTPDVGANVVRFDVAVTAAALASAASVTLYPSSTTKQYKISALWTNRGGTNFSGGGGDRLLSINDGTNVYSLIPAASLQTLANAGWGISAALPFPASVAINTSTVAGQGLRATYSGGAADYAAGSVVISGILERVA